MTNDNQNLSFSNKQKSKWIFDFKNYEKVSIKLNSSLINKKIKPFSITLIYYLLLES